jgi:transcriptional regulator with XRE-family HTH domain
VKLGSVEVVGMITASTALQYCAPRSERKFECQLLCRRLHKLCSFSSFRPRQPKPSLHRAILEKQGLTGTTTSSSAEIGMARKDESAQCPQRSRACGQEDTSPSLPAVIGANLKSLRTQAGHSLERLAKLANVSRAMLSQIENGQSVPTILLLLKVANALGVPLGTLVSTTASRQITVLTRAKSKVLSSAGGRYTLRLLFPTEDAPRVEFYEAVIAPRHSELLDPQPSGTNENLVVVSGRVELIAGRDPPVLLSQGDAAYLQAADSPRTLRNPDSSEAVLHLVINRAGAVGR